MRARTVEAKVERRQVLLEAALDEFFEKGFSAARMDDIAKRAGLSKGALYLYFDSKDAMFVDLIDRLAIPKVMQIEALAAQTESAADAIRAIMRFAPHLVRQSPMPRFMKVLVGDSGRFPEVAKTFRLRIVERGIALFESILERGRDEGEFAIENPQLTARLVMAPIVFSALWHILFESDPEARTDLEALFALHEKMLFRALIPDAGANP